MLNRRTVAEVVVVAFFLVGDAFCCEFFVEPKWRLGNIFEMPIEKLASDGKKRAFARAKQNLSKQRCRR